MFQLKAFSEYVLTFVMYLPIETLINHFCDRPILLHYLIKHLPQNAVERSTDNTKFERQLSMLMNFLRKFRQSVFPTTATAARKSYFTKIYSST